MSALTDKPLKGLQSFAPMLHGKGKWFLYHRQRERSAFDKIKGKYIYRPFQTFIKYKGGQCWIGFIYAMILWYIASINPV